MATKKNNSLEQVYRKYLSRVSTLVKKDEEAGNFFRLIKERSESEMQAIARQEIKMFDEKWIDNIGEGLDALDRIIKDPKKFIKTTGVLTPIELARKTNSESIQHLSSHSQYVKSVDEEGNVIPDKVLNIESEDDYGIYENRFIKTLITKLLVFVERRYDYIAKHADTRDTDIIVIKNKLTIGETVYETEQKIKISNPSSDEGKREYNQGLLDKITEMRKKIRFYSECELMKILKEAKPVFAPIQQTNIIRMNKDYNKCYQLFKFLDSYEKLGLAIKIKESKGEFDEDYIDKVNYLIMFADLTLESGKSTLLDLSDVKGRKLKPKVNASRIIDPALNDSKFNIPGGFGGPTKAQLAREKARKKALEEREKKRQKLLAQIEKEKERKAALKEKERLRKLALKEKARERILKAKEQERLRKEELARKEAERRREKELRDEELRRVIAARKKVAREAKEAKERALQKERERLERQKAKEQAKLERKKALAQKRLEAKKQKELEKAQAKKEAKATKAKKAPTKKKTAKVTKKDATAIKVPVKEGE